MLGRDPRENLRLAQLAATAFAEAGDRRNLAHAKSYVGLAEAELGDLAAGEQTLRQALELTQRLGERLQAACASVYLATVLLRTRQPAAIDEALTLARTVAEEPNGNFFFAGIGYIAWARALLLRGEATAAEPLVRRACAMLSILPTVQQSAVATLVDVLLATDRAAEAQTLCESLLPHAEQHGGYGELGVRLAAVRSRFATGDSDGGRATLQRSLAQLELWAEASGEPAARERFLQGVEEAVELRRLAAEWLA
jgi:hypothetical protein